MLACRAVSTIRRKLLVSLRPDMECRKSSAGKQEPPTYWKPVETVQNWCDIVKAKFH